MVAVTVSTGNFAEVIYSIRQKYGGDEAEFHPYHYLFIRKV